MNAGEFLTRLFENKPEDNLIGIFELPSVKAANFDRCEDAAKYVEGLDLNNADVYFQCGIMDRGFDRHRRGNNDAVTGIPAYWADLDYGDHGKGKKYPPDLPSVQVILEAFPLPPSLIVTTGGGLHVYWLFKEPWIFDNSQEKARAEQDCKRLQATLRGIAAKLGGWTFDSTADLPRVLRVPGTYNNKPGRGHAKVEVLVENSNRYNPDDFDAFMVNDAVEDSAQEPPDDELHKIGQGIKVDPWAEPPKEKIDHLIQANERFRLSWEGDRTGTESWSGTSPSEFALSLATHAAQAGWSDQEITDLIISFYRKHRSSGVFKSSLSMKKATRKDYLARTIAKARASAVCTNKILEYLRLNEDGDARLFVREHKNKFAFDHSEYCWYVYRSHYWEKDKLKESLGAVGHIASLYRAEGNRQAGKLAGELEKRAFALGGHDRRTRVLKLSAAGEERLGVPGDIFDRHPYMLPCVNGVVDLRTGLLEPGKPELFIRNFCPTIYDPAAAVPLRFLQALNDMFNHNQQMIGYLQRLFGLSLIGEYREPVFPIFLGRSGQNGKGTILETFGDILGPELAGSVSPELLLEQDRRKNRGAPSPEIMALMGRRFVWASEVNNGRSLDLSQVKMLTGGDQLVGRDPFGKHEVRFYPSHTIFLVTNVLPAVQYDSAYFHRQQVIEFKYSYLDDPDLDDPYQRQAVRRFKDDLLQERAQILRWAVEGCLLYLKDGLNVPESVKSLAPVFCAEAETVNDFVGKCIENCPGGRIGKTEAFNAYKDFCIQNDLQTANHLVFARAMKTKIKEGRDSDFRFYNNVRLVPRDAKQSA